MNPRLIYVCPHRAIRILALVRPHQAHVPADVSYVVSQRCSIIVRPGAQVYGRDVDRLARALNIHCDQVQVRLPEAPGAGGTTDFYRYTGILTWTINSQVQRLKASFALDFKVVVTLMETSTTHVQVSFTAMIPSVAPLSLKVTHAGSPVLPSGDHGYSTPLALM